MPIHALPITRRRFLGRSATLLTGAWVGRSCRAAEGAKEKWALLADVHLIHPSTLPLLPHREQSGARNKAPLIQQRLVQCIEEIGALKQRPAGVILNGDCAHLGTPPDYKSLLEQFGRISRTEIPVHFTLGNHDQRSNFINSTTAQVPLIHERLVSSLESRRANWFLLDSLTTDSPKHPGQLGEEQLKWLEENLDRDARKPALIFCHHNINPSKQAVSRFRSKATYVVEPLSGRSLSDGLEDTDSFLEVILARKHVKAVFCGHKHRFEIRRWNGIYFVFLPAVGYPFDNKDAVGWLECEVRDGGMTIRAHTLDRRHPHAGKTVDLRWS